MKTSDMFPSKYMKAEADLMKKGVSIDLPVTITSVEYEQFPEDDGSMSDKYIIYFDETPKGLVLNKTNFGILMGLYPSDDTEEWVGSRITLYAAEVQFKDKMVWGTRIRLAPPGEVEYLEE